MILKRRYEKIKKLIYKTPRKQLTCLDKSVVSAKSCWRKKKGYFGVWLKMSFYLWFGVAKFDTRILVSVSSVIARLQLRPLAKQRRLKYID